MGRDIWKTIGKMKNDIINDAKVQCRYQLGSHVNNVHHLYDHLFDLQSFDPFDEWGFGWWFLGKDEEIDGW